MNIKDRIAKLELANNNGTMNRQELDDAARKMLAEIEAIPGPRIQPTDESKADLLALLKSYCR